MNDRLGKPEGRLKELTVEIQISNSWLAEIKQPPIPSSTSNIPTFNAEAFLPGVSLCSPMDWGDIECTGLSVGGRRLHLCGEGVAEVPGRGLHLLRFGDCGLRRASNSIDRFNVAPQAMVAK